MPSFGRVMFRFFQTTALVVFVLSACSWMTPTVLSSPLPLPSLSTAPSSTQVVPVNHFPRATAFPHDVDYEVPRKIQGRDEDATEKSLEDYRQRFVRHRDAMGMSHHQVILAVCTETQPTEQLNKSATASKNKRDDSSQALAALWDFLLDLLGLKALLEQMGADRGLANYDGTNHLETLLKENVNCIKDILTQIYQLFANIPIIGPRKYMAY